MKVEMTAIDPVCHMTVDPTTAAGSYDYNGQTYYFCSIHCLEKFKRDPQSFLESSQAPSMMQPVSIGRAKPADRSDQANARTAVENTCPMHPEVRQDKPGSCPKCGMALEPVTVDNRRQK